MEVTNLLQHFSETIINFNFNFNLRITFNGNTSRLACSFGISWRILYVMKKALHRHRAGFVPQRESSFVKWVKAPQIPGEAARA
jgi:hypothetical protein